MSQCQFPEKCDVPKTWNRVFIISSGWHIILVVKPLTAPAIKWSQLKSLSLLISTNFCRFKSRKISPQKLPFFEFRSSHSLFFPPQNLTNILARQVRLWHCNIFLNATSKMLFIWLHILDYTYSHMICEFTYLALLFAKAIFADFYNNFRNHKSQRSQRSQYDRAPSAAYGEILNYPFLEQTSCATTCGFGTFVIFVCFFSITVYGGVEYYWVERCLRGERKTTKWWIWRISGTNFYSDRLRSECKLVLGRTTIPGSKRNSMQKVIFWLWFHTFWENFHSRFAEKGKSSYMFENSWKN